MALLGNPLLFAQGIPHHGVAPHGQIHDDRIVVEKSVLAKHAQARPLGQVERAMRRRLVPGQQAKKCGLA